MKVMIIEPRKRPRTIEIGNTLEDIQNIVGTDLGFLMHHDQPVVIIYNESGESMGLVPNRPKYGENYNIDGVIHGTFIIVGLRNDSLPTTPPDNFIDFFASIPDSALDGLTKFFKIPDLYIPYKDGLLPVNIEIVKGLVKLKQDNAGEEDDVK